MTDDVAGQLARLKDGPRRKSLTVVVPVLVDALLEVLEIHEPTELTDVGPYCLTCEREWPCGTVEAVTAALARLGA